MDAKLLHDLGDRIDQLSDDEFFAKLRNAGFSFEDEIQPIGQVVFSTVLTPGSLQHWPIKASSTRVDDESSLKEWWDVSISIPLAMDMPKQRFVFCDTGTNGTDLNVTTDRAA